MINKIDKINWEKTAGLIPCIVQDSITLRVLMLGYLNKESLEITLKEKKMTFFSRTRETLWQKGEESGNFLELIDLVLDCDNDTLLAKVKPMGAVCHKGTDTCWGEINQSIQELSELQRVIQSRKNSSPEESYTSFLFSKGINKIAQKVGEEAVELVIEAKDNNKDLFLNEAADLLYHYLVLLEAKNARLEDVIGVLRDRK